MMSEERPCNNGVGKASLEYNEEYSRKLVHDVLLRSAFLNSRAEKLRNTIGGTKVTIWI